MVISATLILWLIMLVMATGLVPMARPWGRLALWFGLVLLTVILLMAHALRFTMS